MSHNPKLSLALAKVMIAAAWADGEVQPEEITCMKGFLMKLPGMGEMEWAALQMYLAMPVDDDERELLVADLRQRVRSEEDKKLVMDALGALFQADGVVTEGERAAIEKMVGLLDADSETMLQGLGQLIRGPSEAAQTPATRGRVVIAHPVYQEIELQLEREGLGLEVPPAEKHKLCLCGCLMARLANADGDIDDMEIAVMEDALKRRWLLPGEAARYVTQIVMRLETTGLDLMKLVREFQKSSSQKECDDFMDILLDVIMADGYIRDEELEEFRLIAKTFALPEARIAALARRIPRIRED